MEVLVLIGIVALIGLATWAIITYIPMPDIFKKIIVAIAVICTLLWLLKVTGLLHYLTSVTIK